MHITWPKIMNPVPIFSQNLPPWAWLSFQSLLFVWVGWWLVDGCVEYTADITWLDLDKLASSLATYWNGLEKFETDSVFAIRNAVSTRDVRKNRIIHDNVKLKSNQEQ